MTNEDKLNEDKINEQIIKRFRVPPGEKIRLKDYQTGWSPSNKLAALSKEDAKKRAAELLESDLASLAEAQELLYADDRYSLLIIFQAMDAAGKDGTIKHVMSGVNPQDRKSTRLNSSHT